MVRLRIASYSVALVSLTLFALDAAAAKPAGDGWASLFDGKTLAGWKLPEGAEKIWTIVDGTIDCNPRMDIKGDKALWSEKEFKDFTLYCEWRIKETKGTYPMPKVLPDGSDKTDEAGKVITEDKPNADSGIYLRGTPSAQINIWCWPIGSGEVYGYRTNTKMPPEVRKGVTPTSNADKPVGEWNVFEITMKGDRLTVVLNGQAVINDAQLPDVPPSGKLALQHHGGFDPAKNEWNGASSLVQFRDIYIKELK
jgi:hypothetical protein